MTIVLADLGGTHLRLSKDGGKTIQKFRISEYPSFEAALDSFAPDRGHLYLASAITPLEGIIEDKRFGDTPHWRIDLKALGNVTVLNDLEAAAYGLAILPEDKATIILAPTEPQRHFDCPPKLLIGVGTGIGHAYLFEKPGIKPFVQRTHGGHVPAFGVTAEHQEVIDAARKYQKNKRDLIMENLVGGNGLWAMDAALGKDRAIRLFWEFLGLYCNMLVGGTGAYGGVYLSGGVIDDMIENSAVDAKTFRDYFIRPMVDVVVESLSSVPVYYCSDINLPILGLSVYARECHPGRSEGSHETFR